MAEDKPHIRKAKELLARAKGELPPLGDPPIGVTTINDLMQAERKLAIAQKELRDYSQSTDGIYETLSKDGVKGAIIQKHRPERLEYLQNKVHRAVLALQQTKREYFADINDEGKI
jgi:hypothetical protein